MLTAATVTSTMLHHNSIVQGSILSKFRLFFAISKCAGQMFWCERSLEWLNQFKANLVTIHFIPPVKS